MTYAHHPCKACGHTYRWHKESPYFYPDISGKSKAQGCLYLGNCQCDGYVIDDTFKVYDCKCKHVDVRHAADMGFCYDCTCDRFDCKEDE